MEGKKQSSETSPTLPTGSIDKAEENENLPVQPTQPVDENKSDIPAESTPSEDKVTDASAEQKPSEDKVEEVPVESKPAEKPVEETGSGQVIGTEDKVISETGNQSNQKYLRQWKTSCKGKRKRLLYLMRRNLLVQNSQLIQQNQIDLLIQFEQM